MGIHNLFHKLNSSIAHFPAGTSTLKGLMKSEDGFLYAYCTGVPTAAASGFAQGCVCTRTNGSAGTMNYVNEGTNTSATWVATLSTAASQSFTGTPTFAAGFTVSTTQSANFLKPDGVLVAGEIVPVGIPMFTYKVTANDLFETVFIARDAWRITHVDFVPDIISTTGTAVLTLNKAIGTTTLSTAVGLVLFTTTSFTLGSTVTIGSVQVGTLASGASTANLDLAAGNRLGIITGGVLTGLKGHLSVRGRRI